MAVSGSPSRPETPSMSLFHLATASPSGMSRAIKALDKKLATSSHSQVAESIFQSRAGSNADLTNFASRLTSANHCGVFIAMRSQIVNGLFAFVAQADQGSTALMVLGPGGAALAWRGKFICRPLLVKW